MHPFHLFLGVCLVGLKLYHLLPFVWISTLASSSSRLITGSPLKDSEDLSEHSPSDNCESIVEHPRWMMEWPRAASFAVRDDVDEGALPELRLFVDPRLVEGGVTLKDQKPYGPCTEASPYMDGTPGFIQRDLGFAWKSYDSWTQPRDHRRGQCLSATASSFWRTSFCDSTEIRPAALDLGDWFLAIPRTLRMSMALENSVLGAEPTTGRDVKACDQLTALAATNSNLVEAALWEGTDLNAELCDRFSLLDPMLFSHVGSNHTATVELLLALGAGQDARCIASCVRTAEQLELVVMTKILLTKWQPNDTALILRSVRAGQSWRETVLEEADKLSNLFDDVGLGLVPECFS